MKPLLKSMATAFFFCIVFASCQEDAWEEAQIPSEDITDNQYQNQLGVVRRMGRII